MDNIRGVELADMQSISNFNKRLQLLLCVTNIYNKHTSVVNFKHKKGITSTNAFQKMLNERILQ